MLRGEIAEVVARTAAQLLFDSCSPNEDLLSRALSFDVDTLESLTDVELSKFVVVLGQYLVTLKYKENEIVVRKVELSKEFGRKTIGEIKARPWKTNVPLKEKTATVVSESAELRALELLKDQVESEFTIVSGMYSAFLEYLNAYKKEQFRRQAGRGYDGV